MRAWALLWVTGVVCAWAASFDASGRMAQLEYAVKAAGQGGSIVALKGTDGVVVLTASPAHTGSPFRVATSLSSKLKRIMQGPYFAASGLAPDARHLEEEAFEFCAKYVHTFGVTPPVTRVAHHLASLVHRRTLSSNLRPIAASCCIIGPTQGEELHIMEIDPTGQCYDCIASCIGARAQGLLEKWPADRPPGGLPCAEAAALLRELWVGHVQESHASVSADDFSVKVLHSGNTPLS